MLAYISGGLVGTQRDTLHPRLHESARLVLTVTHHSYGMFCDFLLFSGVPAGQTPQLIDIQNGLNDVDSGIDVPFGIKIETFCTT